MNNKDDDRLRKTTIAFLKEFADKGYENAVECIDWLERQDKQKPVETIAPKFKVGDWVIDNCGYIWKIGGLLNQFYLLEGVEGDESRPTIEWVNNTFHLWTIQDAKDGDMLVCESGERTLECLFIFKLIADREVHEYCSYRTFDKHFSLKDSFLGYVDNVYHPATQKQHDIFFKKMKEAGYEWDVEKKMLRKIVNEPVENVTPKFRVWDWITSNVSHEDYRICKILYIDNGKYVIESIYGYQGYNIFEIFDKGYHLWTIQDAKEGDVLYNAEHNYILIYKHQIGTNDFVSYCRLCLNTYTFYSCEEFEWGDLIWNPATKEQRELLFLKMHDAGYEWDAENKQPKKIKK